MKHNHNWIYCEIRGVYDGTLFKQCSNCDTVVVAGWQKERFQEWQETLDKEVRSKPANTFYQDEGFYP